jgi:hypothetical protein
MFSINSKSPKRDTRIREKTNKKNNLQLLFFANRVSQVGPKKILKHKKSRIHQNLKRRERKRVKAKSNKNCSKTKLSK